MLITASYSLCAMSPPSLWSRSVWSALSRAGGAHGWVAGRAGFWSALATWVWGRQLQPPGSWAPNLHVRLRR